MKHSTTITITSVEYIGGPLDGLRIDNVVANLGEHHEENYLWMVGRGRHVYRTAFPVTSQSPTCLKLQYQGVTFVQTDRT